MVVAVTGLSIGVVGTTVTVIGSKDVVELEKVVVSMVDEYFVVSFGALILTMNDDRCLMLASSQSHKRSCRVTSDFAMEAEELDQPTHSNTS